MNERTVLAEYEFHLCSGESSGPCENDPAKDYIGGKIYLFL